MVYCSIRRIENGVVYGYGYAGYDIVEQIIPEAVKYLKENKYEKFILKDLNGVDLEIDNGLTIEQVLGKYQEEEIAYSRRKQKEYEEWLASPEGIAEQKREAEEKAKHDAFVFHSTSEAILALTEIKPVDLTSDKTTEKEAMRFCKEVMTVILKCEDLHFSDEDRALLQDTLKTLGCVKTKDVSQKFLTLGSQATIRTLLKSENNIQLPLVCFNQLLSEDKDTFEFGMSKMTEGREKNSWIAKWLQTQEKADKSL